MAWRFTLGDVEEELAAAGIRHHGCQGHVGDVDDSGARCIQCDRIAAVADIGVGEVEPRFRPAAWSGYAVPALVPAWVPR
jgi:hypothetical protein